MFRRATTLIRRPLHATARRLLSTDLPVEPAADTSFVEAWKKVSPNMDPPKTPLSYMKPRPPTPSSLSSKLTINFVLPYASELSSKEVGPKDHQRFQASYATILKAHMTALKKRERKDKKKSAEVDKREGSSKRPKKS